MNKMILLAVFLVVIPCLLASGPSVDIKSYSPGVAGERSAEVVFDVVNMDVENAGLDAFIVCRAPDGVSISSSLGAASGTGAQYVSERLTINRAPSQRAIYLSLNANSPGIRPVNCVLRYAPFIEQNGTRCYQKPDLQYDCALKDSYFRDIRLDQTIEFVSSSESLQDSDGWKTGAIWALVFLIVGSVLFLVKISQDRHREY